jgi:hypothetical protein
MGVFRPRFCLGASSISGSSSSDWGIMEGSTRIVCLCGSTRFKEAFEKANKDETLKGNVVLSVGMFGHQEGLDMEGEVKQRLDRLHFYKIGLADEVLVLDVDGYIGYSTSNEIRHARSLGKPVRFLSEEQG